jgi:hypothetical protein
VGRWVHAATPVDQTRLTYQIEIAHLPSRWTDEDQEKAIVWLIDQRLKCPDCGTREDEWDPKQGGVLNAYHVHRFTCINCKNIEDEYADSRFTSGKKKGSLPAGFKIRLVPDYIWQERRRLRKQREILATRQKAVDIAQARREGPKTTAQSK